MSPRAGLDKTAVVLAAAEIANTEGLEALTITRLAARLGVQAPSLYNHVGGLADLRRELALTGHRVLAERLADAAIGRSGAEALRAMAEAYRAFIKNYPGVYTAGLRASGTLEVPDEALRLAEEKVLRIVITVVRSFGIEGEAGLHAVRALRSMVHGFTTLEILGGFGLPLDLDESFRRLIDLWVTGMSSPTRI